MTRGVVRFRSYVARGDVFIGNWKVFKVSTDKARPIELSLFKLLLACVRWTLNEVVGNRRSFVICHAQLIQLGLLNFNELLVLNL